MKPCGWTIEKAENVRKLEVAERTSNEEYERKIVEQVSDEFHLFSAAEFGLSIERAVFKNHIDTEAVHGEGCRGKFLLKRSNATHNQKIE